MIGKAVYETVIFGDSCCFEDQKLPDSLKTMGIAFEAKQWRWRYKGMKENRILLENPNKECSFTCFEGMKPGVRKVEAQLYPSTYNSYGPHHHRDGDRHLISPMQYEGQKNFADFADSPEDTLISQWNFVKFGIGKESN